MEPLDLLILKYPSDWQQTETSGNMNLIFIKTDVIMLMLYPGGKQAPSDSCE